MMKIIKNYNHKIGSSRRGNSFVFSLYQSEDFHVRGIKTYYPRKFESMGVDTDDEGLPYLNSRSNSVKEKWESSLNKVKTKLLDMNNLVINRFPDRLFDVCEMMEIDSGTVYGSSYLRILQNFDRSVSLHDYLNSAGYEDGGIEYLKRCLASFLRISEIICRFHDCGLVLVDLKPENFTYNQSTRAIKLIDYDSVAEEYSGSWPSLFSETKQIGNGMIKREEVAELLESIGLGSTDLFESNECKTLKAFIKDMGDFCKADDFMNALKPVISKSTDWKVMKNILDSYVLKNGYIDWDVVPKELVLFLHKISFLMNNHIDGCYYADSDILDEPYFDDENDRSYEEIYSEYRDSILSSEYPWSRRIAGLIDTIETADSFIVSLFDVSLDESKYQNLIKGCIEMFDHRESFNRFDERASLNESSAHYQKEEKIYKQILNDLHFEHVDFIYENDARTKWHNIGQPLLLYQTSSNSTESLRKFFLRYSDWANNQMIDLDDGEKRQSFRHAFTFWIDYSQCKNAINVFRNLPYYDDPLKYGDIDFFERAVRKLCDAEVNSCHKGVVVIEKFDENSISATDQIIYRYIMDQGVDLVFLSDSGPKKCEFSAIRIPNSAADDISDTFFHDSYIYQTDEESSERIERSVVKRYFKKSVLYKEIECIRSGQVPCEENLLEMIYDFDKTMSYHFFPKSQYWKKCIKQDRKALFSHH